MATASICLAQPKVIVAIAFITGLCIKVRMQRRKSLNPPESTPWQPRHQAKQICDYIPRFIEDAVNYFLPKRCPTPVRFNKGCHQPSFSRYHCTVLSRPSSSVTDGRQPNSLRMRLASME